jgi:hypothetical protein
MSQSALHGAVHRGADRRLDHQNPVMPVHLPVGESEHALTIPLAVSGMSMVNGGMKVW